jgi:hypothetical protein
MNFPKKPSKLLSVPREAHHVSFGNEAIVQCITNRRRELHQVFLQ